MSPKWVGVRRGAARGFPLRYPDERRWDLWLGHVFDRPASDPPWYTGDFEEFQADDDDLLRLFTATMTQSKFDLARFTDDQIANGISFLMHEIGYSRVPYLLRDSKIDLRRRLIAIQSIEILYAYVFDRRCKPVMSAGSNISHGSLNSVVYMLWDTSSLTYLSPIKARYERDLVGDAVLGVLAFAIALPNIACVESGLHGLNHLAHQYPEKVSSVIQGWLAAAPQRIREGHESTTQLMQYAHLAAKGLNQ